MKAGYKQTEVGVIPADWKTATLASITRVMTNGFVGVATRHYADEGSGAMYVQGFNITENSFNLSGIKYVTQDFHKEHPRSKLEAGDLLTIQTGDIGVTAVVDDRTAGANCHALIISKLNKAKAHSQFISYYLNSKPGRARLRLIETGTTMKHLNVGDMLHFLVPLPPTIEEQQAIASALSDADELIESLEQLLAKKRNLKQGAMQELLTGKRRLAGFGGSWQTKPFNIVFERVNTKTNQIQTSEYQDVGLLPVIDQGQKTPVAYSDDVDSKFTCPSDGAVIFGDHTCIVKFVNFDLIVGADGVQILISRAGQVARFHAYQLQMKGIESTGYNRHFKFLQERNFLCPPVEEQTAIAAILSDMDADITALENQLAKARQIKQGMMQELLTGRIRLV